MSLPVTFHRSASVEFIEASVWYETKRIGLALKFIAEIDSCVSLASKHRRGTESSARYRQVCTRKLRCYLWKQWGPSGYRELRKRGVSVREAWNTSKSAHGPWRLSKIPALALALPLRFFNNLGLPNLAPR